MAGGCVTQNVCHTLACCEARKTAFGWHTARASRTSLGRPMACATHNRLLCDTLWLLCDTCWLSCDTIQHVCDTLMAYVWHMAGGVCDTERVPHIGSFFVCEARTQPCVGTPRARVGLVRGGLLLVRRTPGSCVTHFGLCVTHDGIRVRNVHVCVTHLWLMCDACWGVV